MDWETSGSLEGKTQMKSVLRLASVVLTVCALSAPAMAATDKVSTSVAEKNYNVIVNPLGFVLGAANVGFEFGVSDNIALGPTIAFSSYSSTVGTTTNKATGLGFGLMADISLGNPRFTDSWTLSPFVSYATASSSTNNASASGIGIGADLCYAWFWESGFNLALGFGLQYISIDTTALVGTSVAGVLPSLRLNLGYAF